MTAARRSLELTKDERSSGAKPDEPPPTMKRFYTQALWLDHQDGMHVASAPPPNLAEPPIPPESDEEEHEFVEHVDLKAISLAGLREFIRTHKISPTTTTAQVVRSIVIPATMGRPNCAYADLDSMSRHALPPMDSPAAAAARKAAGPPPPYTRVAAQSGVKSRTISGLRRRAPYYYVVHAWSRPFLEMVQMLETHFAKRPAEHTYVWLDVFAVPQVSPVHGGFLHEIQRAIWYASETLACFDVSGTILGRLWCLYEMFYTLICKQCAHALVALTAVPLTAAQRTALYKAINAGKARCSVKEDKKKLMEHVQGYTRRGIPAINNYLRSGLMLPPHDHPAVYLPQAGYEAKGGLRRFVPCMAPPPPPPPPSVPDHIAEVPVVPEPSIRKGAAGVAAAAAATQGSVWYEPEERPLRLVMGACNVPHPLKTSSGGEDAFFLSPAGRGACGVADGVGSWSSSDAGSVNPAAYSRDLMRATAKSLEASGGRIGARMALADAHLTVKHAGSSTGLVGVMAPDSNILQVVNMGDSGLRLIRGGKLAMATRPQAHAHNMPYQLACPDEPVCDTDSTVQGDVYNIPLEAGDVIIMATDGMYDNVWPDAMLEIVNKAMQDAAAAADLEAEAGPLVPPPGLRTAGGSAADLTEAETSSSAEATTATTSGETTSPERVKPQLLDRSAEANDGIGKHAPVAGDDGEAVLADSSSNPLPPAICSVRAALLARTLARTAAANMLRRDIRSPFAVELSKQPSVGRLTRCGRNGDLGKEGNGLELGHPPLPFKPAPPTQLTMTLVTITFRPQAPPEFRTNPRGGKPDDVTVVVAVVVEADDQSLAALREATAHICRRGAKPLLRVSASNGGVPGSGAQLDSRPPSGQLSLGAVSRSSLYAGVH
ncbi:hypothetical protein GPECTOR_51g727 [Gonium pectorale]|uniref:PPM-type phosphatase domain-containing protein n=1 Tax=Gonium pectorale TaxID=33097 RepID=A0A150G7E4_GONPE|nr:hypothetical protein GPECTOR_51g727 [Gonium pectorale]|eukprot:KXZ45741.1 hypothetical protein GPECTOR_51g727 [Gonium pectorale]